MFIHCFSLFFTDGSSDYNLPLPHIYFFQINDSKWQKFFLCKIWDNHSLLSIHPFLLQISTGQIRQHTYEKHGNWNKDLTKSKTDTCAFLLRYIIIIYNYNSVPCKSNAMWGQTCGAFCLESLHSVHMTDKRGKRLKINNHQMIRPHSVTGSVIAMTTKCKWHLLKTVIQADFVS